MALPTRSTAETPCASGERRGPAWEVLRVRPGLVHLMQASGASPEPESGESAEDYENRIGTRLMALYRDTRRVDSFEALYELTRPAVERWIHGLARHGVASLDTREILQDTFVNVYLYAKGFRSDHAGSFRVWVRTIAGNLVRRTLTRRGIELAPLPEGPQEPAWNGPGPEQQPLREEQLDRARSTWMLFLLLYRMAWSELRPRDRMALELIEADGLSYTEAGDRLGVTRSNMKMIVFRARRKIATRLEGILHPAAARERAAVGDDSARRAG